MKKSFELYINYIEDTLGCKLLDWQKEILHHIYDGKQFYWYPGRTHGVTQVRLVAEILYEEINRDMRNLPARLYKHDGYMADVIIYDELEKEN